MLWLKVYYFRVKSIGHTRITQLNEFYVYENSFDYNVYLHKHKEVLWKPCNCTFTSHTELPVTWELALTLQVTRLLQWNWKVCMVTIMTIVQRYNGKNLLCLPFLLALSTHNSTYNNKLVTRVSFVPRALWCSNVMSYSSKFVTFICITDNILCRSPLPQLFQLSVTEHDSGTFSGPTQTLRILLQHFSPCWTTTGGDELYSSPKMKTSSTRL